MFTSFGKYSTGVFSRSGARNCTTQPSNARTHYVRNAAIIIFGTSFVFGGLVYNDYFVNPLTRALLSFSEGKTGVKVSAEEVHGSLFKGRLTFAGLKLYRNNNPLSNFDIRVEDMYVDFSSESLFSRLLKTQQSLFSFDVVEINGARGSFEKVGISDEEVDVAFKNLRITDVQLNQREEKQSNSNQSRNLALIRPKVDIADLEFCDLNLAKPDALQLLTTTQGKGQVGHCKFSVGGNELTLDSVPVGFFHNSLVYPLSLVRSATFNTVVTLSDRGQQKLPQFHCDVEVVARDIEMDVPTEHQADNEKLTRTVGGALVARYLQRNPTKLNLKFGVDLERTDFDPKRLTELTQQAILKQLALDAGRHGIEWAKKTGNKAASELSELSAALKKRAKDASK